MSTAVDACTLHVEFATIHGPNGRLQLLIEFIPHLTLGGVSPNDAVVQHPRFKVIAPRDKRDFAPIALHVDSCRDHQCGLRNACDRVRFTAFEKGFELQYVSLIRVERFSETRVDEHLQQLRFVFGAQEIARHVFPGSPG